MDSELIAPCGMNCGICSAYLALKFDIKKQGIRMPYCAGCRPRNKKCAYLKKRCDFLMSGRVRYCYECREFPCRQLLGLDRRYRTLYRMSMVENLEYIRDRGIESFLKSEAEKWECPECGGTICCHNGLCFNCGLEKLRGKKKPYRWEEDG